jgi:hypothetical protein
MVQVGGKPFGLDPAEAAQVTLVASADEYGVNVHVVA